MPIYQNVTTRSYLYEVKTHQQNLFETMHGGEIVKIIDDVGGTCCHRWCQDRVSTATFHNVRMLKPLFVGDLLRVSATIIYSGQTSLTAVIYVERENPDGHLELAAQAYATFVRMASDYDAASVPPLPITDEEGVQMAQLAQRIRNFSQSLS